MNKNTFFDLLFCPSTIYLAFLLILLSNSKYVEFSEYRESIANKSLVSLYRLFNYL